MTGDTDTRKTRNAETREKSERKRQWIDPKKLMDPTPVDGMTFRWVRSSILGQSDSRNLNSAKREGWETVPPSEQPEMGDFVSETSGQIENGGLILCWMPDDMVAQRTAHFSEMANDQITAVNRDLMRQNDPRMPMSNDSTSSEKFGGSRSGK